MPPLQNLADRFDGQAIERHPHQGQRQNGRASHGVDVRNGIGGCYAAKVGGIVDDGREEIGRGHHSLPLIDLVNSRIVRGFRAHQQLRGYQSLGHSGHDVLEHSRCDLAAATTPMGKRSET